MDRLNPSVLLGARASLAMLWLLTSVVSIVEWHGRGEELLRQSALPDGWHGPLIAGGAVLDGLVGLALWRWHRAVVYKLAAVNVVIMTAVATTLLPGLWLDPLGSLSKNIPIASLLWILHQDARS
jgi:DoxX-like protein